MAEYNRACKHVLIQFFTIYRTLKNSHHPVTTRQLAQSIERCDKTVYRILACFRDDFACPLEFVRGEGWRLIDREWRLFEV